MKPPSKRNLLLWFAAGSCAAWLLLVPAFAQDGDVPPPPEGEASDSVPAPAGEPAPSADPAQAEPTAAETPTPTPTPPKFNSPEETYQWQTQRLKDQKQDLEGKSKTLDQAQFELWSKVRGITQYPSVSLHGVGRISAFSTQFFGDYGPNLSFINPGLRRGTGHLDLGVFGSVSKPVRWDALFRFHSNLQTGGALEGLEMVKATLEFNPDFLSATLGDFTETYTPLTLFNRDSLDLKYVPEVLGRWNERLKYRGFLDQEPSYPFRGIKVGTDILWPDHQVLQKAGVSLFAHMVRNGYNDNGDGTTFFGPYLFTDWILAAKGSLLSRRWDLGGTSLQASLEAYGVMLDQILDTDTPGSAYDPNDLSTWARQYLNGSLDPGLRFGFGGDFYLGGLVRLAVSSFQDDKRDPARKVSDYALLGGPYLQLGASKLSFIVLDVGPGYFAPLAQTRQDKLFTIAPNFGYLQSPAYFQPVLRGQTFITGVFRPSGYLSFYDRTLDNVFPYGMATPNRRGYGVELDAQAFEKKAFKLMGSAYLVEEMNGNLVVNPPQTGYVPVEDPTSAVVPVRRFEFLNVGTSLNLGPLVGWDRDLEFGANGRYEGTQSQLGRLTSLWVLGGLRVKVLPFLQLSGSFGIREVEGQEAGFSGTRWGRTPYLFDNQDLGQYSVVDMGGRTTDYGFSLQLDIDLHSKLMVDYNMAFGDLHPYQPAMAGDLHNEFMGLSYEIDF